MPAGEQQDHDQAEIDPLSPTPEGPVPDAAEQTSREYWVPFFEDHRREVFFSRQLEVHDESNRFHWITNRVLRELIADGELHHDRRRLPGGGVILLVWHRSHRYHQRQASAIVSLVDRYSQPELTDAVGHNGELLVQFGLATAGFRLLGRDISSFGGRTWVDTKHDLDFLMERDGRCYGVEVKNTLGYPDHEQITVKLAICRHLGATPLFVARMLPRTWINEIIGAGGFALILKYQLYPLSHRALAKEVAGALGLPIDAPRQLQAGTVQRFVRWHERTTS